MATMTIRWTVLLTLVLAACTWSRENPYDPGACPSGCAPGKVCFEGRCVVLDSGAADQKADLPRPDRGSVDATACTGAGQCIKPPGPCHESKGVCAEAGLCHYKLKGYGSDCIPMDPCLVGGVCDGKGKCIKTKQMDCKLPHATGGACTKGKCQGFTCDKGWGDCNGAWKDGCERSLTTTSDCGTCGAACAKVANATTACHNGACTLTCKAPYKDCDLKFANGCEIPEGVANRCDKSGLAGASSSAVPCGTAYCGSSAGSSVMNFGTWYCRFCTHCHKFSQGWTWCVYAGTAKGEFNANNAPCSSCCSASSADLVCK